RELYRFERATHVRQGARRLGDAELGGRAPHRVVRLEERLVDGNHRALAAGEVDRIDVAIGRRVGAGEQLLHRPGAGWRVIAAALFAGRAAAEPRKDDISDAAAKARLVGSNA